MISDETIPALGPRACFIQESLTPLPEDKHLPGEEYLLVKIDPRLHWETDIEAIGTIDTDELVLALRGFGPRGVRPVYPTTNWPERVNVGQILNADIKRTGKVWPRDLRHILIAELWPTLEEAEKNLGMHLGADDRRPWM